MVFTSINYTNAPANGHRTERLYGILHKGHERGRLLDCKDCALARPFLWPVDAQTV